MTIDLIIGRTNSYEIIRRPHNTPRQWARRLAREGIPLPTADIQHVLEHYQIDPKKGLLKS